MQYRDVRRSECISLLTVGTGQDKVGPWDKSRSSEIWGEEFGAAKGRESV